MSNAEIFKFILNYLLKNDIATKPLVIKKLIEDGYCSVSGQNIAITSKNYNGTMASAILIPLVSYCGGNNFGSICLNYDVMKAQLGTSLFLFSIFYSMVNNKGLIVTTNNSGQQMKTYAQKMALLAKRMGIEENLLNIVNPNTDNGIEVRNFEFYKLTKKFKSIGKIPQRYEYLEELLDLAFNIKKNKEEANEPLTDNKIGDTEKPKRVTPVRAS